MAVHNTYSAIKSKISRILQSIYGDVETPIAAKEIPVAAVCARLAARNSATVKRMAQSHGYAVELRPAASPISMHDAITRIGPSTGRSTLTARPGTWRFAILFGSMIR